MFKADTIAAISTPFGEGAIAMLRLSGPDAIAIADAVFRGQKKPSQLQPRLQQFGQIRDGESALDDVLLAVHRGPASYTGEDVVEISGHGGILVSQRVLQLLLARGARVANPGEFTERAFLNGKMDLTQAEAVMDLIGAQTELALQAATGQLEGKLGDRVREIREELLETLAHLEAYIDFPEEGITPETGLKLVARIQVSQEKIALLLQTAGQGKILREGARTVIYGAPNVGKSSLLNWLLGYERAMVSELPGTTRDTIEEVINLRGLPLRLIDTAGLRDSTDALEKEGMARTLKNVERADLVLHVFEADQPREALSLTPLAKEIRVLNKIDLGSHESWQNDDAVRISCRTGEGMEMLADAIFCRMMGGAASRPDYRIAINARHQSCLQTAAPFLHAAERGLRDGVAPELVSIELRSALESIGEIVGKVDNDELLGKIFSTFCIGK